MIVRVGVPDDLPVLEELWRAFEAEVPPPPHVDVDAGEEIAEIRATVDSSRCWVAELDGAIVGMALARRTSRRLGRLTDLYVRPAARGRGVATALVREVARGFAADGVEALDLEVMASNLKARAVYERWGFREDAVTLVASGADARGQAPSVAGRGVVRLDPRADRRRGRASRAPSRSTCRACPVDPAARSSSLRAAGT